MSIVTEYVLDLPSYVAVLEDIPEMRLVVEQMAACDPETVLVTFWAEGKQFETLEAGLDRANAITAIDEMSEQVDGQKLYQVWLSASATAYQEWVSRGGVLLDCTISHEGLWMRMRFPDREALIDYRRVARDKRECSFRLTELQSTDIRPESDRVGMTSLQQEVLAMAVEEGYFDIPREITMAEIASHFEISDQAASERLRRGLSTTVSNHLPANQNGHRRRPRFIE